MDNIMRNAKFFLFAAALTLGSMQAFAVKGIEDGSKYGTGEDSIRCLEQLSLYQSYYTIKDYNSAYSSWKVVFDECPKAGNRTFYSRGAFLIANQMSKDAADPAKYKEWFDLLMKCYEARVQYCGNDTRYPEPYIRGRQAIDFIKYSTDEDKHAKALPWLKMAVDKMAENVDNDVAQYYFQIKTEEYMKDAENLKDAYIAEYLKMGDLLDKRIAKNDKNAQAYQVVRSNIDQLFAASGAADCTTLESVFGPKLESMKDDVDKLSVVISLFKRARCNESDVYFTASEYSHKLSPTAESAAGCGYLAARNKNYSEASKFFEESVSLATDDSTRYESQYMVALLQMQLDNYTTARAAAYKAASFDRSKGDPYILIAQMYADSKHNPYPDDPILSKTVYWAAVDKLVQAKNIDPECAEQAQQLINQYTQHYPSKEDVFFKPELNVGDPFTIGGWIGESVICRD